MHEICCIFSVPPFTSRETLSPACLRLFPYLQFQLERFFFTVIFLTCIFRRSKRQSWKIPSKKYQIYVRRAFFIHSALTAAYSIQTCSALHHATGVATYNGLLTPDYSEDALLRLKGQCCHGSHFPCNQYLQMYALAWGPNFQLIKSQYSRQRHAGTHTPLSRVAYNSLSRTRQCSTLYLQQFIDPPSVCN
jgi:hypothetical protein